YGDVPYYDHVLGSEDDDLFKSRDDRGYVMDRVMEDFAFAAEHLPPTWGSESTRVTKWAALAYASRVALFEGTFRKYHGLPDADKYLEQAVATAKVFITTSPFSIYKNGAEPYRELFYSDNAKTAEVVLARRYDPSFSVSHSVPFDMNFGRTSLTRRFMNHYLMADGSRFTDKSGWETMLYNEETRDRDPRMAQTVLCPGYKQVGSSAVTKNTLSSHTGYQPIKYIGTAATSNSSGSGNSDWILMRAAEVYLNYAEALAELGTITQNDLDISVNKIRARVNMPAINLLNANSNPDPYLLTCYPNVTQSANTGVILEIRRERTIELVMETPYRSWDLFRWKEAKQALNYFVPYYGCYFPGPGTYDMDNDGTPDIELYENTASSTLSTKLQIGKDVILSNGNNGYIVGYSGVIHGADWKDNRDYLWPIPANQRVLNPNLKQNPNWEDGLAF
ncbi:MAG TPA: RagB/SusD family nutrient uptake outer membrane protein, partial [Sphingobacterium sp.]|nr:RagB/SusD family nutrient uptake outer membrane protein [Sphingobacterium sp.]